VGQGTWEMERTPKESIAALRRGLDLGMTHVDTAEMYGAGEVEALVGKAIAGRRDEVFLVSKVLPSNASYDGTITACERSLKRLKTDRLDVYLLHWRGDKPLGPCFDAMRKLRDAGKIRAFGVSNFDVEDLEECPADVVCNQVLYHLKERAIEHWVAPLCAKKRIAVVAYSPLGEGDFPRDHADLAGIARAHGVSVYAVALAWLAREAFVIPKSSVLAHVEENAKAGELELTAGEVARIDGAFPRGDSKPLPMI
jgi:diketogulonate reductase-like aldo/keto reductase